MVSSLVHNHAMYYTASEPLRVLITKKDHTRYCFQHWTSQTQELWVKHIFPPLNHSFRIHVHCGLLWSSSHNLAGSRLPKASLSICSPLETKEQRSWSTASSRGIIQARVVSGVTRTYPLIFTSWSKMTDFIQACDISVRNYMTFPQTCWTVNTHLLNSQYVPGLRLAHPRTIF